MLRKLPFCAALWLVAMVIQSVAAPGLSAQDGADQFSDPIWRFVTKAPPRGWKNPEFDDRRWKKGPGGFGTHGTPGARIATVWRTPDIWMRRTIELKQVPAKPALLIYHDEGAEVFINGKQVATVTGHITEFKVLPLDAAGREALKVGENLVAVHCHQTAGGQGIDVHVVDADNVPELPAAQRPTTPFKSDLITTWGEKVTAENVWQDYPRPQMTRKEWRNLNGHWDYAISPREQSAVPTQWAGKILVPFCLESKLSGVQRLLNPEETLWYHVTFDAQPKADRRTLLNFEAVDYRCDIYVNDKKVGGHTGGNVPFSVDVSDAIQAGKNKLVVRVDDDTEGFQLNGKQRLNPAGIFYTQVSGIWQTVWLEEVPARHIDSLKISTDASAGTITVKAQTGKGSPAGGSLRVVVRDGQTVVAEGKGQGDSLTLKVENPKLWSPSDPHLYDLTVSIADAQGTVTDEVGSYVGIRAVGKARDEQGNLRFTLNGKPIFHWGPLDQGWWPDGLLTPPSEEAMLFDIEYLKSAGFNMIRKHIKVEPRRYYYDCDRLGMLVWQDQVSGGENPPWTRLKPNPKDAQWSDKDHAQFMAEFEEMVSLLENHPSIVVWTPFNEAWGQHRTVEVGEWMVKRDPSRLVNVASGGNFWPVGDVVDEHSYPHPNFPFDRQRFKDFIQVVG
ncbi:MAG: glycoside hydrolase family 2 protein, partial [Planctomycetaceae bacterium]